MLTKHINQQATVNPGLSYIMYICIYIIKKKSADSTNIKLN